MGAVPTPRVITPRNIPQFVGIQWFGDYDSAQEIKKVLTEVDARPGPHNKGSVEVLFREYGVHQSGMTHIQIRWAGFYHNAYQDDWIVIDSDNKISIYDPESMASEFSEKPDSGYWWLPVK